MNRTPGRNERCPCGSGLKYKACCLRSQPAPAATAPGRTQTAHDLHYLGLRALESGRAAEAAELLTRTTRADPGNPVAYNNLGIALKQLGQHREAAAAYRMALELDPRYAPAHHNLGEIHQHVGARDAARSCFEKAIGLDPRLSQSHVNLGNLLADTGELQQAVDCYRQAIDTSPAPGLVYLSLGLALKQMGDDAGALDAFRHSERANPSLPEAHFNVANALLDSGQTSDALTSLRQAMSLRPQFAAAEELYATALGCAGELDAAQAQLQKVLPPGSPPSQIWIRLGSDLVNLRRFDAALGCFERARESDPTDRVVHHLICALNGTSVENCPTEYVRQTFDEYAETFDQHLLGDLGYTLPHELQQHVLAEHGRTPPWDALDLGCGTGLVGSEIAQHCRSLVGVDLSEKMLQRARDRKVYNNLKCTDLLTALESAPDNSCDLVVAADVFIYVGNLNAIVPAVRRVLRPGGLFAFSVESPQGASLANGLDSTASGYLLSQTGRYVHKAEYLQDLAANSAFDVKLTRPITVRLERRRAVSGLLCIWSA